MVRRGTHQTYVERRGIMSMLFTPVRIGSMEVPNRFVRSATFEAMATDDGHVTDELADLYARLAQGEVGLIVVSLVAVHATGAAYPRQLTLGTDEAVADVQKIVGAVRARGQSRVVFQLAHSGRQGDPRVIGKRPKGPSAVVRDPVYFFRAGEMDEDDIEAATEQFVRAAVCCREGGADGIQIHAVAPGRPRAATSPSPSSSTAGTTRPDRACSPSSPRVTPGGWQRRASTPWRSAPARSASPRST
jgi:hypothetical protein